MSFVVAELLSKRYGRVAALSDCSLAASAGEVVGLLGPNGAGKTTLIRLLLGFLRPTSGGARIGGHDCGRESLQVRRLTAYLPGEARLFRTMRARDVLEFFAGMRPESDPRTYLAVAERLDLELTRRVAQMSTGMRQKLALAATFAAETPLLILDEPTSTLDPTVRGEVIAMVLEAKRAGRTVLLSSHVLSEVEEACDRVLILRQGRVMHTQEMAELRHRHRIHATLHGGLADPPAELAGQLRIERINGAEVLIEAAQGLAELLAWLAHQPLQDIRIESGGLRGVYERFHTAPRRRSSHVPP